MGEKIPNAPFWVYNIDDETLDEVYKLIFHSASDSVIAKCIFDRTGLKISHRDISSFKVYLDLMEQYMLSNNEQYHKRYMEKCFVALDLIIDEIQRAKERRDIMADMGEYKVEKDYFNVLKNQIELLAKLKGEIKSVTNIVNADKAIVNVELNTTIMKKLEELLLEKGRLVEKEDGTEVIEVLSPELVVRMKQKKKKVAVGEDSQSDD